MRQETLQTLSTVPEEHHEQFFLITRCHPFVTRWAHNQTLSNIEMH